MALNDRSRARLEGVHPDLVRIVERAGEITPDGFIVTEGLRSLSRQKELVARGASRTLKSRHLDGHAVDLADLKADYKMADMRKVGATMKLAAADLGIALEWGGDWKSFVDTPHFQLPWKDYPSDGAVPVKDKIANAVRTVASTRVLVGAAAGGSAVTVPKLPAPPDLSQFTAWQGAGETVSSLATWASGLPLLTVGLVGWVLAMMFWNRIPMRMRIS